MCKAYGFGCLKDPQPMHEIILTEKYRESVREESGEIIDEVDDDGPTNDSNKQRLVKAVLGFFEHVLVQSWLPSLGETEDAFPSGQNPETKTLIYTLMRFLSAFPRGQIRSNMLWAAYRHGFPWVAQIMARVCDVTEEDLEYGSTPLHVLYNLPADFMGSVAEEIVRQGASVDAHCNSNAESLFGFIQNGIVLVGTPLNWAGKAGNFHAVQCLLDLGADPLHNCQNCDQSPLETAISLFRADIVKVFLDTTGPIPPVPVAGSDQRLPEVTYAVLRGFLPRISHEHARSVLYGSALAERSIETLDVVLTYVKYGEPHFLDAILYWTVSPDICRQPTLLMLYLSIILIERGASQPPRLGSQGGGTPLLHRIVHLWEIHGVNCEAFLESILQLYPDRIDISLPNKDGRTALHEAAIFNAYPMIFLLVKYGADINAEDTECCTLVSWMNSEVSFELLLDLGAETTHSRGSVLHDGALPQFPRSIIPFALLESKHREKFLVPEILEGIHEILYL